MVLLEGREVEVAFGTVATPLPLMAAALPDFGDLFFGGDDATRLVEAGAEATEDPVETEASLAIHGRDRKEKDMR